MQTLSIIAQYFDQEITYRHTSHSDTGRRIERDMIRPAMVQMLANGETG
jgi:hypothetical protein